MATAYASSNVAHGNAFRPTQAASGNAPQGTFLPGTKVQVGSHRVTIDRYLSEGGFAHVYVVRIPRDGNKYELAVLKRVAVPDKEHLTSMRTEVETMKKLKGHKHIVTYIDSHANQMKGGGYEVFLLMEFCSGGGLIDFMNTRLQHRLVETEILKIFGDVAEGLACMHYLKPPLLHRDLKIENVLISKSAKDGVPVYKLADFGSAASPTPAATTAEEGRLIEDDVQKHTTMQYRSPEMIDVWRKRPIDEKADIWAMGVFLYKLCYYTTPFEEVGQMAILNATFKYPSYPQFSDRLKRFIGSMLREDPKDRPNIYQVIKEVCSMRGTEAPIKDIYSSSSQRSRNDGTSATTTKTTSAIGLQREGQTQPGKQNIPEIAPMRRGRPGAAAIPATGSTPAKGDPFAALDSKDYDIRAGAVDELAKKFPSLDDFSIAHETKEPFKFDVKKTTTTTTKIESSSKPVQKSLNERVTNALADEAFAVSKPLPKEPAPKPAVIQKAAPIVQTRLTSGYVSTAVGTSPPDIVRKGPQLDTKVPEIKPRSIWRVPSSSNHKRSTSQPRASADSQAMAAAGLRPDPSSTNKPAFLDLHRSKSQTSTLAALKAQEELPEDHGLLRAQTTQTRSRPSSTFLSSGMDFLRGHERKNSTEHKLGTSRQPSPRIVATDGNEIAVIDDNIENELDFLHSKEDEEHRNNRKGSGGMSFGHRKRNSLPSISGATKEIFKGRFGDAFKRFEPGSGKDDVAIRTPSEEMRTPRYEEQEPSLLSPIAGSDATPSRHSEDAYDVIGDAEELPADVRREMERRRLSQEERRVAEAARQYRERVAANGTGGVSPVSRGTAIQQRVQTLLDEGSRSSSPVKRTAEGYGRFTDAYDSDESLPPRSTSINHRSVPIITAKKPSTTQADGGLAYQRPRPTEPADIALPNSPPQQFTPPSSNTAFLAAQAQRIVSRPSAPPKPKVLRTAQWPPTETDAVPYKSLPPQPSGNLAALLAKDLEGVPDYPARQAIPANGGGVPVPSDDLEDDFSRRYPSLSGIEMVETDLVNASNHKSKGM